MVATKSFFCKYFPCDILFSFEQSAASIHWLKLCYKDMYVRIWYSES